MKNYIIKLQDKFINDEYVKDLLFIHAIFKAKSCKQLAIYLKNILKADDYELKYFKCYNMFVLRLNFNCKDKSILVTYNIYTMINL